MNNNETRKSRRDLLRDAARFGVLGAIGALSFRLLAKWSWASEEQRQECINKGFCSDCGRKEECGLPRAGIARNAERKERSRNGG